MIDHLEKCGLFCDFLYGFRSSWSNADPLKVVSDRIWHVWGYSSCGTWSIQSFWQGLTCLSSSQTQVFRNFMGRYLALFLLFSVINSCKWFWMESLHKNIQLILEFVKIPFLVLHLSYFTMMTFLMISVILLSMLMILLSILNVIRHLICGNNLNWLLNSSLIYATLQTGVRSGLLV